MDQRLLEEIVRRVVEVVHPERIILFGSAAKGPLLPDSDVDLLVIRRGLERRRDLAGEVYKNLIDAGTSVDVVLVTPEEVDAYRNKVGSIIRPALESGREVYAAPAS